MWSLFLILCSFQPTVDAKAIKCSIVWQHLPITLITTTDHPGDIALARTELMFQVCEDLLGPIETPKQGLTLWADRQQQNEIERFESLFAWWLKEQGFELESWLAKGLPSYLVWRLARCEAWWGKEQEREHLKQLSATYLNSRWSGRLSLYDADAPWRSQHTLAFVRSSGFFILMALEYWMEVGLDEVLHRLFDDSRLSTSAIGAKTLQASLLETDHDLSSFLTRYVKGTWFLPLEDCMYRAGIDLHLNSTVGHLTR